VVPPAFTPSVPSGHLPQIRWERFYANPNPKSNLGEEGGGLGLRYNGRSRPSYDRAWFARPCEGKGEVDFSVWQVVSHRPTTL